MACDLINFKVSAPGKVILLGEHSVVYGKCALAASLSFRTSLHFIESNDKKNRLKILLPTINLNHSYSLDEINRLLKESPPPLAKGNYSGYNLLKPHHIDAENFIIKLRCYLANLVSRTAPLEPAQESALVAFFLLLYGMFSCVNIAITPLTMHIVSDLVVGAGTGSSASYGVCLASAFYQYLRKRVNKDGNIGKDIARNGFKTTKITATDMTVFDEHELNLILGWGMLSDKVMHGNPSGLDATVITLGNMIKFRREEPGKPPTIIPVHLTGALKILLVNSGVTRNTKGMVAGVAALRGRYPKIVNSVLTAMDEVTMAAREVFTELEDLKKLSTTNPTLIGDKVDYSIGQLGELIEINQNLLCSLGVSHPTLDEICTIAREHRMSAKLTGAGGGGYAYILIPHGISTAEITIVKKKLKDRGYEATLGQLGGPGVILDDDTQDQADFKPSKENLTTHRFSAVNPDFSSNVPSPIVGLPGTTSKK